LVKYLLTHEELTLLSNGEKITDKIPNSITFFENMSLLNFSNSGNNCIEIDTYEVNYCTNEDGKVVRNTGSLQDRCAGGYHTVIYTVVFIDAGCLSSGGNSGYDPINNGGSSPIDYDGWGNPTGGPGGSPSGNNNPNQNTPSDNENSQPTNGIDDGNGNLILTTPILLLDQSETHIDELKKITDQNENNSNLIRNKINEYVGMLFSAQTEIGIEFRKNSINTFSTVSPINSGFDFVQFSDAAINTYVRIHLHHNFINSLGQAIDPIPSDGDIFGFAKAFAEMGNSSGRNNFTSIIVSRNGLYAMKVSDINKLLSFHYNLSNKTYVDNVREGFTRYVTNLARTNCNNCSIPEIDEYLEILFISFLKNQIDCGINIYKGTLNNDNNYNWIKL
jgi:hypothetical protein